MKQPVSVDNFRACRADGMMTVAYYYIRHVRAMLQCDDHTPRQRAAVDELCAATEERLANLLKRLVEAKTAKEIDAITWSGK